MSGERRFPFEKAERLESPERHARQPADRIAALVAGLGAKHILDVGAGTGYFALPIAEQLGEARIVALDVEVRMLDLVRSRAEERGLDGRIETLEAPPDRLPMGDGSVDLVLMVNLYHELDDRPAYLKDVLRVLSPGGRVVVCDWDPESTSEAGPPRDHRVPASRTREELEAAGFAPVERQPVYDDFYTLVGQRAA